ncbi:MAG: imidazole glycerol phosphate synthase subunit HisH [Elusimicrobiota bacterium]|jgi:glutamine amidotransferase|nr:imidazole glycerol phosphate synthase subunit HisH [Elusimicrobiota bacterium]
MPLKIAIIDYGFGNIRSVLNALNFLGVESEIISDSKKLEGFAGAILPGVGAFAPAAEFLKNKDFDKAVADFVKSGKMLYGICLGFQLFFTKSYENGIYDGLNLMEGEVKKFEISDKKLKIPHIGWNSVSFTDNIYAKKMFDGVKNNENFYFVHSYYPVLKDEKKAAGFSDYGIDFCSCMAFENVWGSQFHPEKSGDNGLLVLKNFIKEVFK